MTEKQKRCIAWICDILDIEYTGTTKRDAWEFINKYKDEAHEISMGSHFSYEYYDDSDYLFAPDEGYFC